MRRTVRTVIPVLAATSILLMSAKADAAYLYDWDSGTNVTSLLDIDTGSPPPSMNITTSWTARDNNNYYFRMDLLAAPTEKYGYNPRDYRIFIGPAAMTSFDLSQFNELIQSTFSGQSSIASVYGAYLPDGPDFSSAVKFNYDASHPNTLEWRISRSYLTSDFTIWWGTFGKSNGTFTQVDDSGPLPGASTPIPGAAWLLASGIIGLIGLRRRSSVPGSDI